MNEYLILLYPRLSYIFIFVNDKKRRSLLSV